MTVTQVKGYTVLPVRLDATSQFKSLVHFLFIKKHVSKEIPEGKTRSLFFVNLPVGSSFASMKRLISEISLGANIESFHFCEYYDSESIISYGVNLNLSKLSNPDFGEKVQRNCIPVGCGIVTFLDKSGLDMAYNSIRKIALSVNTDIKIPKWDILGNAYIGSNRYRSKITGMVNDSNLLASNVASSMEEFENREHKVSLELNDMKEQVDEDGFTIVVGPHRKTKSGIIGSLKTAADLMRDEKYMRKVQKRQKNNFYRFQIRERKKQEVSDLLQKFKDDQERVRAMREKRRFNPY